jgi:hypothetical protein
LFYQIAARFIPAELAVDLQAQVTVAEEPLSLLEIARRYQHIGTLLARPQPDPGRVLESERVDAEFVIPEIPSVTPAPQIPGFRLPEGVVANSDVVVNKSERPEEDDNVWIVE